MKHLKLIIFLISFIVFLLYNPFSNVFAASIEPPSSSPQDVEINQTFSFNTKITSIQPSEVYFVKCRLGESTSSLTQGQTYNSSQDSWLSDTNSWEDFPTIETTNPSVDVTINCRVKSGVTDGQKLLYARACLKKADGKCGTSFQSATGTTLTVTQSSFSSSSPSPSPPPSPSSSTSPSSTSTFTISNVPSQIDSTQTFTVSVNLELSSYPNTKFYLKGAFKKEGSSNYFGLTKVGSSWIKNGDKYSKQFSITTDSSGHWSGNLEIQPDSSDAGYQGSGDYIFKVARYTDKGSGPTWSNETNIKINAKETEIEEGETINLSKLAPQKSPSVLGKKSEKKLESLPEVVYSLESYKKSSTQAAKHSSPSSIVKSAQKKNFNLFYLFGGIFLFASGGLAVYLFLKTRVKSPS